MSLFGTLLGTKAESVAFIDIAEQSVGAAIARFEHNKVPRLIYETRTAIGLHPGETPSASLARALAALSTQLTTEGGPTLLSTAGTGAVGTVEVALGGSWQKADLRVEKFESEKHFTLTRALLEQSLAKESALEAGRVLADETMLTAEVNGYETRTPFGMRISRAQITMLMTTLERSVSEVTLSAARSLFHTAHPALSSFARVAFSAIRALFPHEEDYLVIEMRDDSLTLLLIKRHNLAAVRTFAHNDDWADDLSAAFAAVAANNPLPSTAFLLAEESESDDFKTLIERTRVASFGAATNSLRVMPITAEFLAPQLDAAPGATPDLFLALAIIAYAQGAGVEG